MSLELGLQEVHGDGSGSLNGQSVSSGPDHSREASEGSGNSEDNSVVVELSHSIVVEENSGVSINVGPGVLDLSGLLQDTGDDSEALVNKLDKGIVLDVSLSEVRQMGESGIGLSEDGMTESGDDSSRLQDLPDVVTQLLVRRGVSNFFSEVEEETNDLLVSESVKGTSKTVESSRVGKVGIRESRTNKMAGVGRDVSSFVITVDSEVSSEALSSTMIIESEHVSVVSSPVELGVSGDELTILVLVSVDESGESGDSGNEVDGVLINALPVLGLVDTAVVSLVELRLSLEEQEGHGELSHGVNVLGDVLDEVNNLRAKFSSSSELILQIVNLSLIGDLSSKKKPVNSLGKGFLRVTVSLGELGLDFRDRIASESDTLIGVEL